MTEFDATDLSDEQLEAVLKDVLRPVTDTHRSAAIAAYEWRFVDAELASLTADSRLDESLVLRDAPTAGEYQLSYTAGDTTFTIDLEPADAHTVNAVVLVDSPVPFDGTMFRLADGSGRSIAMTDGSAVIPGITSSATFRLEFQRGGRLVVISEWISL